MFQEENKGVRLFLEMNLFGLKKVYEEPTVITKGDCVVSMVFDPKSLKLLRLTYFNSFSKQERKEASEVCRQEWVKKILQKVL